MEPTFGNGLLQAHLQFNQIGRALRGRHSSIVPLGMSILRKRASCASLECMGNTLNVMQDACCDRMDVFDRARMEKALAGPSYTIPDHVRTAQAIVDFISSKATPPKYEPLVHANLWNGEENV